MSYIHTKAPLFGFSFFLSFFICKLKCNVTTIAIETYCSVSIIQMYASYHCIYYYPIDYDTYQSCCCYAKSLTTATLLVDIQHGYCIVLFDDYRGLWVLPAAQRYSVIICTNGRVKNLLTRRRIYICIIQTYSTV